MTTLPAPRPVPEITKRLRLQYRSADGSATYFTVTAEGSELLTIHADGYRSSHIIGGVCVDCAFGTQCTSPDCPRRNRLAKPANCTPVRYLETRKDAEAMDRVLPPARPVADDAEPAEPVADADPVEGRAELPVRDVAKPSRLDRVTSWGPGPGGRW
jgi:hypothetical protein